MSSTKLFRSVSRRRRLAVALLVPVALTAAPPAAALSRAMWAEFNAIYLINLKPAAECRPYRTRSIELLKDASLSPVALDERMHALWNEAKASCLAKPEPEPPSARQRPDSAAVQSRTAPAGAMAATPAAPAAAAPAPAPTPPPARAPAAAAGSPPHPVPAPTLPGPVAAGPITTAAAEHGAAAERSSASDGRGNAAPGMPMQSTPGTKAPGDGRPPIALPQLKPAIERPRVADLRLEAACAKRNPYAYQVASDEDPCVRLASAKAATADPIATKPATAQSRDPAWVWSVAGAVLAALGGAGGWWLWRRRRSRTAAASADADHDGAGDVHARQRPRPADDASPADAHHAESLAPALS